MKRKLSPFAAATSLLLCAATMAFWINSARKPPPKKNAGWTLYTAAHRINMVMSRGSLTLKIEEGYRLPSGSFRSPRGKTFSTDSSGPDIHSWLGRFGFYRSFPQYAFQLVVYFPIWWLNILLALPPAIWTWRMWRTRLRNRTGLCPNCSYNLTGNTSGVCPECGIALPATQ